MSIDRAATAEYGIPGVILMENAARGLLEHAIQMIEPAGEGATIVIVCGPGNNGGDGYALARHLHNRAIDACLAPIGEPKPESDAGVNHAICRKMRLREVGLHALADLVINSNVALIVDAIFGTGLDRPVSGKAADAIAWINRAGRPVLAVDVPSGMDCNTGEALGSAVKAHRTVTFVGPKVGFFNLEAQELLGEVAVVDIGAPIELVRRFGRSLSEVSHREAPEHDDHGAKRGRVPGR
jgi:NAD(P)H-hydrate epimerase